MVISQKDIAKALKLSPATISKALRNSPDIGSETRAMILAEASRLGYQPALSQRKPVGKAARNPKKIEKEMRFVGVFYCQERSLLTGLDNRNILYLDGLSESASFCDSSLVVHRVNGDGRELLDPANHPSILREGLLCGAVLIYKFAEEVVYKLAEKMPVVTLTHWVPGAPCDHVDSDHLAGLNRLVGHLKSLGHRRLGIASDVADTAYAKSRCAAAVRAMVQEGLELRPEAWLIDPQAGRQSPEAIAEHIAVWLPEGFTAWVLSSDGLARGVWDCLEKRGVRVPQQVSLTGFDGLDQNTGGKRLTTVKVPFWEMGVTALERLMQRVECPTLSPMQMLLDCPLLVGDSTGPAAAGERMPALQTAEEAGHENR